MWRIENGESGVVGCWKVCHRDADADLLISLISLAQLREDLGRGNHGYRRATDPVRLTSRRSFRDELSAYLESAGGLDPAFISHIFVIAWRSRILAAHKLGPDGNQRRSYLVRPVGAFPGDFQGITSAWSAGDRHAIAIANAIGRRLIRIEGELNTWEELIGAVDWLEWLEYYSKAALGQSHVLQPVRPLRK